MPRWTSDTARSAPLIIPRGWLLLKRFENVRAWTARCTDGLSAEPGSGGAASPRRPGFRAASWSKKRLQVGAHDSLDPAEPCEFHQVIDFGPATFPIQLERFDDGVLADSVAELETVRQRLLGAVDSYGEAVHLVGFDPVLECALPEPEESDRRWRGAATLRPFGEGHPDPMRYLGRGGVEKQRREETKHTRPKCPL